MTICPPSTCNITLGLRPRAILPASGEQTVMLPSHKGNNCIMVHATVIFSFTLFYSIPCISLILFFSEIVLISSRVKYFTSDITFFIFHE